MGLLIIWFRLKCVEWGAGLAAKGQGNHPACLTALAAHITGRPVKMVYDRDDDMKITGKRHDIRIDYHAGFDDDGKILGVEFDQALRCGMSFDLSKAVAERAVMHGITLILSLI